MTSRLTPADLNWETLGFDYIETGKAFRAHFKEGQWSAGEITTENTVTISHASPALHLGQQCFEGLKAYRTKDGSVQLFRPDQNGERMMRSADQVMLPPYPVEDFVAAAKAVVQANEEWVPPYATGATLYLRPFLFGSGAVVGVGPGPEAVFGIYVTPVGPYFKGGLQPANFMVSDYDRAAPRGTGAAKVGGNYASSFQAGKEARAKQFADAIFLDPATHTKIEEVGSANFFGITHDNVFVTPKSPSILPSITKYSLLYLAKERLGLGTLEGDVYLNQLDQFKEAGAMGTAAVITPVGSITYNNQKHVFHSETQTGPLTKALYEELVGIQFGDKPAPEGWIQKVPLDN
ncbi:branched-chain amino acid aminotransferase [Fundicoccus sp. Sow4_D5]|uniref:branched-chain amino acid aminotransferase n=1 Tax=unclassified Fundicoccus TaxID=2761543 RepID=UPI003F925992